MEIRVFPIIDRNSALNALANARLSVASAPGRDFSDEEIERAKDEFRDGWNRRLDELEITDLPRDPFALDESE